VHNWSFSVGRVEYQTRPAGTGVSSFKHLLAKLPPRVHSVYYRDGIGNISSSHLRTDSRKVIYVIGSLKKIIFLPSFLASSCTISFLFLPLSFAKLGVKNTRKKVYCCVNSIGDHMAVFIISETWCFFCLKVMSFMST